MYERDYSKCDVCGQDLGPDRIHVLIDNGHVARHTYAHRRHRYVAVEVGHGWDEQVQVRTDLEIESLAHAFRFGDLAAGWE